MTRTSSAASRLSKLPSAARALPGSFALVVLLAMTVLAGCGQKGPLVLPDGLPSGAQTAPAASDGVQSAPRPSDAGNRNNASDASESDAVDDDDGERTESRGDGR